MCGIAGAIALDGRSPIPESMLQGMIAAQQHRGPDQQAIYCEEGVGLAFCRLAIIDLSPAGHQPMTNEDGTIWLVFNGEIYNFRDLIPELLQRGHQFRSRSDSEVILHAYEEWGVDCLSRFNGMFAFAIWDSRLRRLFVARDRLGVKPLYYWSDGTVFAFASELKALLTLPGVRGRIDPDAVRQFFVYEYVAAPRSIFAGVKKLPAASYLVLPVDGSADGRRTDDWSPTTYWNVAFGGREGGERSAEDYADELRSLLKAAVARRLISDVPLGAFLSGGIDSSSIVALMAEVSPTPPRTFTIGFKEASFSELRYAQLVSRRFGTDHQVEILDLQAEQLTRTVADYLDEPFADASALPTYLVSQAARRHVTVVLSGDGGDELFAGYDWYRAQRLAALTVDRLPSSIQQPLNGLARRLTPTSQKKGARDMARAFLEGAGRPAHLQQARWQAFWSADDLGRLLDQSPTLLAEAVEGQFVDLFQASGSDHPLDQQQYADVKRYLPDDILFKVDRMSMAVSLETRGPFLDYTLVEFAARIPPALRLRGLSTKYLLKQAMRGLLPDEILHRPKLGFNIPYKNWLRGPLYPLLRDALAGDRLRQQNLFNPGYVEALLREHLDGSRDHHHQLWQLLMFQLWYDRYAVSTAPAAEPVRLTVLSGSAC